MHNFKTALAILLSTMLLANTAFAAEAQTANIKLNIATPASYNKYFLCFPGNGCFSILAGKKGKIYPSFRPFHVSNIFLANIDTFRVYPQGLPASCNVEVNMKQTITVNGKIVEGANDTPHIVNLSCKLS